MEVRNITVVSTKDQKRTVVSTDATTLSELKSALAAANVDYEGMTFYEGLTHTELLTDDAILPHDVPYKGTVTNELVFMLTNPNKKIRSGALSEARAALYSAIAERGLEQKCVEKFGKNLTNCSNAELLEVIEEAPVANAAAESASCSNVEEAIRVLVDVLYDEDYITDEERNSVLSTLANHPEDCPYSSQEISDMFAFVNE